LPSITPTPTSTGTAINFRGGPVSDAQVVAAIRECYDPEIPINVYDLGLIYDIDIDAAQIAIRMTLTAPGCGMGDVLVQDVREKVELVPTVSKADVELVFDPPWSQDMMSEAARLQTGMM
jgi:probable FeS assembly SUF system protein SufT